MLHNFVISIADAATRREHVARQFSAQNLPFEFFNACTPGTNLDALIARHLPRLADTSLLTAGEKACFMSHYLLWQHALEQGLPHIAVFEDDIVLGNRAAAFLQNDGWLKQRFGEKEAFAVKLETFLMPVKSRPHPHLPDHAGHQFRLLDSVHWGAAAYILSAAAIKKLQNDFAAAPADALDAVDMLLFNRYFDDPALHICQISPAPCIQEPQLHRQNSTLASQLEQERFQNQQTIKQQREQHPAPRKTLMQRIKRAFGKPARMREKRRYRIIPFEQP